MRILIIGGTAFVGRHIAQAALDAGHDVSLFHRGKTGAELFPQARHLTGDRDGDLTGLARDHWDATIDVCAYFPRQVRSLAAALAQRGGRYVFISSVSAYSPSVPPNYDESAPLAEIGDPEATEVTAENYGGLNGVDGAALPLWAEGESDGANQSRADPAAAFATGLSPRPLRQTVADIRAAGLAQPREGVGISAGRERELLTWWAAGRSC